MKIKITKLNSRIFLKIGKNTVELSGYKISSPENVNDDTELELKIVLNGNDRVVINELSH